jgi:competence protein ComEA
MLRLLTLVAAILFVLLPAASASASPTAALLLAGPSLEGQLNLNTASVAELDLLPGIGPATAEKIIAHRNRQPFQRPAQLMRIKGIGKKKFAKLRPYVVVDGDTTLRVAGTG